MSSLRNRASGLLPARARSAFRARRAALRAWLDRLLFPSWLVRHCRRHGKRAVIIWRTAALGDVVCTLPLAHEIRRQHPDALLVYITGRGLEPLVTWGGGADLAYGIEHIYGEPAWVRAAARWCRGQIEQIYEPLTTDERVPGCGVAAHLVDDLAISCGFEVTERQPRIRVPDHVLTAVRTKFELHAGQVPLPLIGINCGRTWPVREWEAEKWGQLIEALQARHGATFLQFGVDRPGEEGLDPYREFPGVRRLVQALSAAELVALIASCDLVISIDSGPVHLAGSVGTPVVGLFGAVAPQFRLPPDSHATGLASVVPCVYCHHRNPIEHWKTGCPYDIQCMTSLEVEPVLEAAEEMLASRAATENEAP